MKKLNPVLKILFISLGLLAVFILFLCANFIFKKLIEYQITREFLEELYGSIMYFIKHGGLVFIFTSLAWFFGNKIYNKLFWKKRLNPVNRMALNFRDEKLIKYTEQLYQKDDYIKEQSEMLEQFKNAMMIDKSVLNKYREFKRK